MSELVCTVLFCNLEYNISNDQFLSLELALLFFDPNQSNRSAFVVRGALITRAKIAINNNVFLFILFWVIYRFFHKKTAYLAINVPILYNPNLYLNNSRSGSKSQLPDNNQPFKPLFEHLKRP